MNEKSKGLSKYIGRVRGLLYISFVLIDDREVRFIYTPNKLGYTYKFGTSID